MTTFLSDIRFAARSLRKTPGFTAIAALTIAIGIGFGSANFSLVHEILIRPVVLPEIDRLALVQEKGTRDQQFNEDVSARAWLDWQKEARSFQAMGAFQEWGVNLTGGGPPEKIIAFQLSPEVFPLLRTPAALGRTFAPDEVEGKNQNVVVLSDGLWRRRYGAEPGIVGSKIFLDGSGYTVVGVMPRSFKFPRGELWAPLWLVPKEREDRGLRFVGVVGRLRPGVSMAEANAEMRAIAERHATLYPRTDAGRTVRAIELVRGITEDTTRAFIFMLMVTSGFLLLIVCANVANLLLARGSARRREMAVRAALGARRWLLARQLLTESLLLALFASALSLLVAAWSLDFIKGGIPPSITRYIPGWENMGIDLGVLCFTLGVAVLTAVLFGLAPALALARTPIGEALKESGRSVTGGRRMQRLRSVLVVLQVSLALVLLAGAGVIVKGFVRSSNPRRGLDPDGVLVARVALPEGRYKDREPIMEFQRRVLEALRAIPGVDDAAASSSVPWGQNNWRRSFNIEGRSSPRPEDVPAADYRTVSPGYLSLLRVPLRAGVPFTERDNRLEAQPVAIISEAAARIHWPEGNAIGSRFSMSEKTWTVVGIVGDLYNHYDRLPRVTIYVPAGRAPRGDMYFVVRTSADPAAVSGAMRAAIAGIDPELPVAPQRLLEVLGERVAGIRLGSTMMSAFAVVALLLAGIGIYGVIGYLVAQRRQEIGVRMALGARPRQVLRLVMGGGARLTLAGVAVGLPAAIFVVRLMSRTFFDLVDADAWVIIAFTVLVASIALLGTLLPARQATKVDPMIALRSE
jgi:putative ABC transport system permease protein